MSFGIHNWALNFDMRFFPIIFLIVTIFPTISYAEKVESNFDDWNVYSVMQDGEKICYLTSYPKKKTGNYKKRGNPYFLVTYRGNGISEVSVYSGYPYKSKSMVELDIDDKHKHELFTSQETPKMAWAKDAEEDKTIILEMKKGIKLQAKAYSRLNSYSLDSYSLRGFTKAFDKMKELCSK